MNVENIHEAEEGLMAYAAAEYKKAAAIVSSERLKPIKSLGYSEAVRTAEKWQTVITTLSEGFVQKALAQK